MNQNHTGVSTDSDQMVAEELDLRKLIQVIVRRKYVLIGVVLPVMVITYLFSNLVVPKYKSSARILIENKGVNVLDDSSIYINKINMENEIAILKSPRIAKKVAENLDAKTISRLADKRAEEPGVFSPRKYLPSDWADAILGKSDNGQTDPSSSGVDPSVVDILVQNTNFRLVPGTSILEVTYQSTSPAVTAKIADQYIEVYIAEKAAEKYEGTQSASKWLGGTLEDLKEKVIESETALEEYKREIGIAEGNGDTLYSQQLSNLNAQLIDVRAKRLEQEVRIKHLEKLRRSRTDVDMADMSLTSPLIQSLRFKESELLTKYSELKTVYGKKHPVMINAEAELEKISQEIDAEIGRIIAALKSDYEMAKVKEKSVSESLKGLKDDIGVYREGEVKLRELQREAEANRIVFESFLKRYKEVNSQSDYQNLNIKVIENAKVPTTPFYPNRKKMLFVALAISLLLGGAIVFALDVLEKGYVSAEQIETLAGVPTIGIIPVVSDPDNPRMKPFDDVLSSPRGMMGESVYGIRNAIAIGEEKKKMNCVLVTSAEPSEGKTTFAVSLARIAALYGQKSLLIDCDLRKPAVQKAMKGVRWTGLVDYLNGEKSADEVICRDVSGADFISTGKIKGGEVELLFSDKMAELVSAMKERYELVILDSTPVLAVSESVLLSKLADQTLFVVKWNSTRREAVNIALRRILERGGNLEGIVLSQVDLKKYSMYDYGDSKAYGKYYSYYGAK